MPSRLSWPVIGGPAGHLTGVTLASDDSPSSLTARQGWRPGHPWDRVAPRVALRAGHRGWGEPIDVGGAGARHGRGNWR